MMNTNEKSADANQSNGDFDQQFLGTDGDDHLEGGAGNDTLIGREGRDILEDGLGDDVVVRGAGSKEDTYRYRSGDGNDNISNIGVLELLDLNPDDVRLRGYVGDPHSQAIDILETGQTIRFGFGDGEAQATAGHHRSNLVDKIKFADGTVWNEEDLIAALNAGETLTGTMGDDVILGYAGNDILEGAQGNDTLYGGTGNDTYRHHPGDGNDTVFDGSGSDTLELSRLKPADVSLNATARGNLEVLIKETGERIKIGTQGTGAQIDRITFSNRKSWGQTELDAVIKKDVVFSGTDADDHLFGWQGNDRLEGGDGHDRLDGGAGNDILMGGAGNDTLIGGTGRDILEGGLGDDVVVPGAGSEEDTYRYRSGDGNDNIFSIGVLELLDLNPDDVRLLGHVGDPFYSQAIEILETGQTIRFGFNYGYGEYGATTGGFLSSLVDKIKFADGTVWNEEGLIAALNADETLTGTRGNDVIDGYAGNDILEGAQGNDTLRGGTGNDTYLFNAGSGADKLIETGGTSNGNDTLKVGKGIAAEQLWFRQNGHDLEVSAIGTKDRMTIANWDIDPSVEQFVTSDGKTLRGADVLNLVQAMAAFSPPASGETVLSGNYRSSLDSVIAANWH